MRRGYASGRRCGAAPLKRAVKPVIGAESCCVHLTGLYYERSSWLWPLWADLLLAEDAREISTPLQKAIGPCGSVDAAKRSVAMGRLSKVRRYLGSSRDRSPTDHVA